MVEQNLPAVPPTDEADRAALAAQVSAGTSPTLRPASLTSSEAIRPLPVDLLVKLEQREQAGLARDDADHPRRELWQRVVLPAEIGAGAAAIALLVALISSHPLVAVVAAAVLAAFLVLAASGWRWIQADPLRIDARQRHMLDAARSWQSRQPWAGALAATPERALVESAVVAAGHIAASPAWRSGYLDEHRLQLDLAAELDAIDAQAYQVAQARAVAPAAPSADPSMQNAWTACLDRVVALRRYAAGLEALSARIAAADTELHSAGPIAALTSSSVADSYATGDVRRLGTELDTISSSLEQTLAEIRKQRAGGT